MSDQSPPSATPRFDRWQAWCAARGIAAPTPQDFLDHGRLSTLERLSPDIDAMAPGQGAALRAALRTLRREKRERVGSHGGGGRRGPEQKLSVDEAALPDPWRRTLDRWRTERRRLDAGGILFGDQTPPAADLIDDIAYVLRAIGFVCVNAGRPIMLTNETIAAWLDAAEARGCKASGLGLQLGLVLTVLTAQGGDAALGDRVAAMRATMRGRAQIEEKRKAAWLRENPRRLGGIWDQAEDLLEQAMALPATRYRRAKLVREAAALALGVAAPLRIGDLGRFVIGVDIRRTAIGWSLDVVTRKKRHRVERPELWAELTPFLDALVTVDGPADDFWTAYDARSRTPLFSRDGGATAMNPDWFSDVWEEHVGCGAHIVRTLWHEVAHESDADLTWVALALCGQKDERTARHYQVRNAAARQLRNGRAILKRSRMAAISA
jgi:hypothetical protein